MRVEVTVSPSAQFGDSPSLAVDCMSVNDRTRRDRVLAIIAVQR
jgi:hypothetical protein